MGDNYKNISYRMLLLIATPKLVDKAAGMFKEGNVPTEYIFHGQGTATSEIMDMLGLDGVDKNILMGMLPKPFADEMLKKLRKSLHLGMPNTGIAFTLILSGGSGYLIQLMEGLEPEEKKNVAERNEGDMADYSLIMTIVNQGFSEEVMNAARPRGASGGTVFHSRRIGNEEAMKLQEIGKQCGMKSKAQGIVMSLPVDGIAGLD